MKSPLFLLCLVVGLICPSLVEAQCAGGSCGARGGFFRGGYSAPSYMGYAAPQVVYESTPVIRSTSSFSTSSGYTRDSEGYLIAPDGARVTAIDGTAIGPTLAAKSTESSSSTADACECCRCEERLAAMEKRIDELETRIPVPFGEAQSPPPAPPKANWEAKMAAIGKPLDDPLLVVTR